MLDLVNQSASTAMTVVQVFVCLAVILVLIPLHECAHGWTAKALGDPTPEKSGRLSLNPLLHIDFMGTLAIVLFGFGWGKPIPVNPHRCTKLKPRAATAVIALAGPIANLILAYFVMIVQKVILYSNSELVLSGKECTEYYLFYAAAQVVSISIYFAVFNLLPIPPFDGARFFLIFLPTKLYMKVARYERVIATVMFLLLFLGVFRIPLTYLSSWINKGLYFATGYVEFFMGI